MTGPQEFATLFARTLALFRDPNAKEDQKAQFRALMTLLKNHGAVIGAQNGQLVINGEVLDPSDSHDALVQRPGPFDFLVQRLELHAVKVIAIRPDPPPAETFELLRGLADSPSDEDLANRLRTTGVKQITVVMQPALSIPPDDVEAAEPEPVEKANPPKRPIQAPKTTPIAESDVPAIVRESLAQSSGFAPAAASKPAVDLIAQLREKPSGPNVGDLLAVLGRQFETAMKTNRVPQALNIVEAIVRAEQQVTDATYRRQYSIALKRMYSKAVLEAIAEIADHPSDREGALLVLRRAGEDGVEVLLELLVAAPTLEERRGIFLALTGMKEGTDQVVHMLGHHQWFVVRNVAELAGELGLEEAVPALGEQLNHADERVRKACALALAKIGSSAAAEPLRRALRDKSPEVRMQAALGVGGRKAGPLAMPLVVAMEEEEDESVERELMMALGRIASPAAVQALIKFAQPGGRLFGRQPTARRVVAVEALRIAATPAAVGTLEGLTNDGDRGVRDAAESALADLKQK
ncbi:MAG TPA: HEAT repeat domain-containing protein [Gemmatimonadales bacterium]|nr:HEAT repeat domain-containing protein [Gemmatimonadales bacterium]